MVANFASSTPAASAAFSVATETYAGSAKELLTISLEDFIALFRNRKTPIKAALLNQSLLHGIGNIYADVKPSSTASTSALRHAGRLTRAELTRLREALQKVLTAATVRRPLRLRLRRRRRRAWLLPIPSSRLLAHRQPCCICTTPIKRVVVGGRSTHFCPTLPK